MTKKALKKGLRVFDTRTLEQFRVFDRDGMGIVYARSMQTGLVICIGGARDTDVSENCRYFDPVLVMA